LERLQNGGRPLQANSTGNRPSADERRFADIIKEKPLKVTIRVLVPVKEHPKVSEREPNSYFESNFPFVRSLLCACVWVCGVSIAVMQNNECELCGQAGVAFRPMLPAEREHHPRFSSTHKFRLK
jgi:hypothetical protein